MVMRKRGVVGWGEARPSSLPSAPWVPASHLSVCVHAHASFMLDQGGHP